MEGKLFRQLRKERGLSMQELANEWNSVAFISKFEKGNTNISFKRFEQLLNGINVTMEEFLYLRSQAEEQSVYNYLSDHPFYLSGKFVAYLDQIFHCNHLANKSGDFAKGQEEMRQLEKAIGQETNWGKFLGILCQLLVLNYQVNEEGKAGKTVDLDHLFKQSHTLSAPIVSYLYKIDNWSVFEVMLFRFFQFSFPVETTRQLLRTAVARTKKQEGLQAMQGMRFELLFGTCTTFINFQKLTWAQEVLKEAEELLYDQGDLLNSSKLLFYQGWLKIASGSVEMGKQKCDQALSIFRILQQPEMQQEYSDLFSTILKNREEPNNCLVFA